MSTRRRSNGFHYGIRSCARRTCVPSTPNHHRNLAVVSFGAIDLGDPPSAGAIDFALPDGMSADPGSAALHAKAVAFQARHPGTDYMAAVAAVNR